MTSLLLPPSFAELTRDGIGTSQMGQCASESGTGLLAGVCAFGSSLEPTSALNATLWPRGHVRTAPAPAGSQRGQTVK